MKSTFKLFAIAMMLVLMVSLGGTSIAQADEAPPTGSNTGTAVIPPTTGQVPTPSVDAVSALTGITDPAQICQRTAYEFADYANGTANPPTFPGGTFSGTGTVVVVGSGWSTWNPPSPGKHLLYAPTATYDIIFTTPQQGAGVKAEPNPFGVYNIAVTAFDASNNSLGSFTRAIDGNAGAAFLGLLSPTANIKKLTVNSTVDFAFSDVTWGACLTATILGNGLQDGHATESNELSNVGRSSSASGGYLQIGDSSGDRQIKGFLSFDTSSLPDTAVVAAAHIEMRYIGAAGTNPYEWAGSLNMDIASPFGTSELLTASDFQNPASAYDVATCSSVAVLNWYSCDVTSGVGFFNRQGFTQFRLYFDVDDNDDRRPDYVKFASGNNPNQSYYPVLVVYYGIPESD